MIIKKKKATISNQDRLYQRYSNSKRLYIKFNLDSTPYLTIIAFEYTI